MKEDLELVLVAPETRAADGFAEHDADREEIGAAIDDAAARLFRRHVRRLALDHARVEGDRGKRVERQLDLVAHLVGRDLRLRPGQCRHRRPVAAGRRDDGQRRRPQARPGHDEARPELGRAARV